MSGRQGFSLIELILVLFLIGLIAGLVTPFLISTLERTKSQSEVRKIASTLRYARNQAISQKTPFAFAANIDDKRYWITPLYSNETLRVFSLAPEIRFSQFVFQEETIVHGSFSIVFYPQGSSSGGSIDLETTSAGKAPTLYSIALDPVTGKPLIEERTVDR